MAWVRFTKHFDFYPKARSGLVCIAYRAGTAKNVTRECVAAVKAAGAGVMIKREHVIENEEPNVEEIGRE